MRPCTEPNLADMRLARAQDQALGISPDLTSHIAEEYEYLQRKCTELAVVHHSFAELGADHGVGRHVSDPHRGAARPALYWCSTECIVWHPVRPPCYSAHLPFKLDACAGGCFQLLTRPCLQPLRY